MDNYSDESPAAQHDIRNMINKCTWCVKVFVTSPDGNWEDCGTGSLGFYRKNDNTGELECENYKSDRKLMGKLQCSYMLEPKSDNKKNPLFIGVTKQNDRQGHPDSITASPEQLQKLRGGNSAQWILYADLEKGHDFDRQDSKLN